MTTALILSVLALVLSATAAAASFRALQISKKISSRPPNFSEATEGLQKLVPPIIFYAKRDLSVADCWKIVGPFLPPDQKGERPNYVQAVAARGSTKARLSGTREAVVQGIWQAISPQQIAPGLSQRVSIELFWDPPQARPELTSEILDTLVLEVELQLDRRLKKLEDQEFLPKKSPRTQST